MADELSDQRQCERVAEEDRRDAVSHFDATYYLACNPGVREAGIDPLEHFLRGGWREGRNPSRCFDVYYYLRRNPDVAAADMNPLLHYVRAVAREGRSRVRPHDAWRRQIEASSSPRQRAEHWAAAADLSMPMEAGTLARRLEEKGCAALVVSVSHDDYARTIGGVQLLIGDEMGAFGQGGWSYLHVSPAAPLPMLADPAAAEEFHVGLRLDGDRIGVATFADLLGAVAEHRARGANIECIFHHLMGHAPELALALVRATETVRPIVWVHDFFSLCPSYALMRNDVLFCGAPPPDSVACGTCCYGGERALHLERMHVFFETARPAVLAPSAAALNLWQDRGRLPHAEASVQPPARLLTAASEVPALSVAPSLPLRVAHLGSRSYYKGWTVFQELAQRLARDERYIFLQIGTPDGPALPEFIRNIPVRVDAQHRDAMVDAVAEARVDVAINWSLCFETFSFAVHEALAGGAYVIARNGAGNVWPAVSASSPPRGCVLTDEAALLELFQIGALRSKVCALPKRRGTVMPTGGSATWLMRRCHAYRIKPLSASSTMQLWGYPRSIPS